MLEKVSAISWSLCPKFIDFSKCDSCGLCIRGCKKGAKWDSAHFVNEAKIMEQHYDPNIARSVYARYIGT
ncbi:MAG: 4Fe-4S binding protein [Methanobacterium sp.]